MPEELEQGSLGCSQPSVLDKEPYSLEEAGQTVLQGLGVRAQVRPSEE